MDQYIRDFNNPEFIATNIKDQSEFYKIFQGESVDRFAVFHMNIRSIAKNFNETSILLDKLQYNFDVIIFTECWKIYDTDLFNIKGFQLIYNNGNANQNDGIVMYVKSSYNYNFEIKNIGNIKAIQTKIHTGERNVIICALYRSPSFCPYKFNENLNKYLEENTRDNKNIYFFIGDINIDIKSDLDYCQDYMNIMGELGFKSLINSYTREQKHSKTCIDHIFLKEIESIKYESFILKTDITDHHPIVCHMNIKTPGNKSKISEICRIDKNKLKNILQQVNWGEIYEADNVDTAARMLINKIKGAMNSAKIMIHVKKAQKKRNPWITTGLMKSVVVKQNMYEKVLADPNNPQILNEYKTYKNKLCELIKRTKSNYYKNQIEQNKNCSKTLWDTVKKYTNKGTATSEIHEINISGRKLTDKREIANAFNQHYTQVGKIMADKICKPSISVIKRNIVDSTIFLNPTDTTEVAGYINELNNHKSPGMDAITAEILKLAVDFIKEPLTHVINKILETGNFPNAFKTAVIKPLFKKGNRMELANYRPISLISTLAKVAEKTIKKRITAYLEKYRLLSEKQFGFKQGVSTEDAIVYLTDSLYKSLDNDKAVLCVFLDLAKAFDTVSHKKLIEIVEDLGFRGVALELVKSYLANREQFVKIGNELSNPKKVEYGVPQGTVLGPIFFSIYINGLLTLNTSGNISSFADDTVIIYTDDTWKELKKTAENDLKNIKAWFDEMHLTINFDKTKFLPFSCKKNNVPLYNTLCVTLDKKDFVIESANHITYLGIEVDRYLKWDIHVGIVVKKLRSVLYIFKQMTHILNTKQLIIIYHSLVESHLHYGLAGWGGIYDSHLKTLEIMQKLFIKIMYNKDKMYSTENLYTETKILDMRQLYCYRILCLQQKKKHELINIQHNYDTRHKKIKETQVIKATKTIGQRSYYFLAPRIYSILPHSIKRIRATRSFKIKLKIWLKDTPRSKIHSYINLKDT